MKRCIGESWHILAANSKRIHVIIDFLNYHQKPTREETCVSPASFLTAEVLEEHFREKLHLINVHILPLKPSLLVYLPQSLKWYSSSRTRQ